MPTTPSHSIHWPLSISVCLQVSTLTLPRVGQGGCGPLSPCSDSVLSPYLEKSLGGSPLHQHQIPEVRQSLPHPSSSIPGGSEGVALHMWSAGWENVGSKVRRARSNIQSTPAAVHLWFPWTVRVYPTFHVSRIKPIKTRKLFNKNLYVAPVNLTLQKLFW